MIAFPSDLKFIRLKKLFQELKILMSTYEGLYQPWSTFWPPHTSESDEPLSLDSDDTMFVIATCRLWQKYLFKANSVKY